MELDDKCFHEMEIEEKALNETGLFDIDLNIFLDISAVLAIETDKVFGDLFSKLELIQKKIKKIDNIYTNKCNHLYAMNTRYLMHNVPSHEFKDNLIKFLFDSFILKSYYNTCSDKKIKQFFDRKETDHKILKNICNDILKYIKKNLDEINKELNNPNFNFDTIFKYITDIEKILLIKLDGNKRSINKKKNSINKRSKRK